MLIELNGARDAQTFRQAVIARSGQNLLACLQCGKCTGGCPVAWAVARGPRQIIALVLLGLKDEALKSELPWYCVGCSICASRCPVRIDFSRVAGALVEIAASEGRRPAVGDIHRWEEVFLASVQHNGRVREVRAILENNLRAGRPWHETLLGLGLFARGLFGVEDVLGRGSAGQPAVGRIFETIHQMEAEGAQPEAADGA